MKKYQSQLLVLGIIAVLVAYIAWDKGANFYQAVIAEEQSKGAAAVVFGISKEYAEKGYINLSPVMFDGNGRVLITNGTETKPMPLNWKIPDGWQVKRGGVVKLEVKPVEEDKK